MAEYVRRSVGENYGNASEFFRELVRARMDREVEADVEFLGRAMDGAPVGPSDSDLGEILALQKQVRKELRARGA